MTKYFTSPQDNKEDTNDIHIGTNYWVKYINSRIDNNKNFLGCFIGQTGTGKSYSAISFAKLIDKDFKPDQIFMRASEFMEHVINLKSKYYKGKVLIWDESGKDLNSKEWASKSNRIINVVLQTFRKYNIIVLFTLPYFSFLDSDARKLVHGTFETETIDLNTKECLIKPFILQVNQQTGKIYQKYLKVNHEGNGISPVERIRIKIPDEETLKFYENKKDNFTNDIYLNYYHKFKDIEHKENRPPMEIEMDRLTERQQQVYKLALTGLKQTEIGKKLGVTQETISESIKSILKRLNIKKIPLLDVTPPL
jgi:DNA-binding CsgD family transcriptional regulator